MCRSARARGLARERALAALAVDGCFSAGTGQVCSSTGIANRSAVAELLGVALADVTVFGDHLSDLGMLRGAGTAVAVRNAHPEALQAAQVVVPSNDEDGVVHYLLEHHAVER
jgi:phosphoserine phosphatase